MELLKIRFPSQTILTEHIFEDSFFKNPYYVDRGITGAVAMLAADRFAGRDRLARGILLGAIVMAEDIRAGVDSFTHKEIIIDPLTEKEWEALPEQIKKTLLASVARRVLQPSKSGSRW
ncbi:MAG: hypothetical protein JSR76_08095 [Verrucomicrobia bacterium]|nr:hypothetical protein [Verrucomicrobiota bacterium]